MSSELVRGKIINYVSNLGLLSKLILLREVKKRSNDIFESIDNQTLIVQNAGKELSGLLTFLKSDLTDSISDDAVMYKEKLAAIRSEIYFVRDSHSKEIGERYSK